MAEDWRQAKLREQFFIKEMDHLKRGVSRNESMSGIGARRSHPYQSGSDAERAAWRLLRRAAG
jgi:hypothetical protein